MNTDHDAFNKGKNAINGISNSVSHLIGNIRNASLIVATGLGTIAVASGSLASKTLLTAEMIGVSAESLKTWGAAARIARVSSDGLINAMGNLDTEIVKMGAKGDMNSKVFMAFGQMQQELKNTHKEFKEISADDFIKASAENRAKMIFNLATKIDDQKKALIWVGELLGQQGQGFYNYLKLSGMSVDDLLSDSASRVFETEESMKKSMEMQTSMIKTLESLRSISNVVGGEVSGAITPFIDEFNDWLVTHGDEITEKITKLGEGIKTVADSLKPIVGDTLKAAVPLFKDLSAAMTALLAGDWDKLGQDLEGFFGHFANGAARFAGVDTASGMQNAVENAGNVILDKDTSLLSKVLAFVGLTAQEGAYMANAALGKNEDVNQLNNIKQKVKKENEQLGRKNSKGYAFNSYSLEIQNSTIEMINKGFHPIGFDWLDPKSQIELENKFFPNTNNKIQDGIIRPNGQVTQVAPDDWVFAMRDVGDFTNALASKNTPAIPMRSWAALLEDIQQRAMEVIPAMSVHNNTNAPQHITININQSVETTSNEWLPQTLREQAAMGVQDGMQQARKESFNRLQMMSGTL